MGGRGKRTLAKAWVVKLDVDVDFVEKRVRKGEAE
jgi:hypothetical protein